MEMLGFNIIAARTNPMIKREIRIPAGYSILDFVHAACISLGITYDPDSMDHELIPDGESVSVSETEERDVSAVFSSYDRAELIIKRQINRKQNIKLMIYIDYLGMAKDGSDIPVVVSATSGNLPSGLWDIREINAVLLELTKNNMAAVGTGVVYTKQELAFSSRKAENAMRRHFAPDTAKKEIKPSLRLPLKQLLNSINVSSLRYIADTRGVYLYSATRKAEIISRICDKFNGSFIEKIFDEMGIGEFLIFRAFVLDDEKSKYHSRDPEEIKSLFDCGLLNFVKDSGFKVAAEVLDHFEEFYDTEKEIRFIKEKYMRSAFRVCVELYGIFDLEMFAAVVEVFEAEGITEDDIRKYFEKARDSDSYPEIGKLDDHVVYDRRHVEFSYVKNIYARWTKEDDFFVPDKETAEKIESRGLTCEGKKFDEIPALMLPYMGYYYYNSHGKEVEIRQDMFEYLHWGKSPEYVFKRLERSMYQLGWESQTTITKVTKQMTELIRQIQMDIPIVELKGYTLRTCPMEMKRRFMASMEEAKAEKKGHGRKSVAVRKAVKRGK